MKQRTPKPHLHRLEAFPASEADVAVAPASHPAFAEPKPMPVWKCQIKGCDFETWSLSWFRR